MLQRLPNPRLGPRLGRGVWPWVALFACVLVLMALLVPTLGEKQAFGGSLVPPAPPVEQSVSSEPFRFVALGDTGSGASFQYEVAKQMLSYHHHQPYPLALVLGDILYPSGEFEKDGDRLYTQVYAPIMKRGVAFKVAIGNHDVVKGFRPGILSFYKMPARYYSFSQGPVDFFALDTNIFDDVKQQQWLDKALSQSKAPWKIVYGHHPIFSSGLHTSSASLKKTLLPILQKHRVPLYLAGHDHDYERFSPIGGVTQIVSGGGGAYLRNFLTPEKGSLVRQKRHHFLSVTVTDDTLTLTAIDKTGVAFDTATLTRKPVVPIATPAVKPQPMPTVLPPS